MSGITATYDLDVTDLDDASDPGTVKVVAVAENATSTLVSDAREITVGDWGGAETYTPLP